METWRGVYPLDIYYGRGLDLGGMEEKLGRNDPCSCGSGKKYKNCCLHKKETKTFTPEGKRKFKATLLSGPGSMAGFAAEGFKATTADFRVKEEERPAPKPIKGRRASRGPKAGKVEQAKELPGDFLPTSEDFRVEEKE